MNTLLSNLLAAAEPSVQPPTMWFPKNAANDNGVDGLFYFIFWVSAFFLVLNAGLMVYFALRYRQRNKGEVATGHNHNTAMEVTWSVIPAFILAIIFVWGFRGYLNMVNPPNIDPQHEIAVTGFQWSWDFTYPNGETVKGIGSDKPALHVPAGVPIRLSIRSTDVLHSVFIPAFRVKKDAVPGRVTQLWFEPIYDPDGETIELQVSNPENENEKITLHPNVYDFFCTEYCGTDHSRMVTKVYVYSMEEYEQWYASMTIIDPGITLVELGGNLYGQFCASCHTTDGGSNTGPTWRDLYGNARTTDAGQVTADDAYIIESIRNPSAQIVDGFTNSMTPFGNLSDREVRAIIEYMKTLSGDGSQANPDLTYGELLPNGDLKEEGAAGDGFEDEANQETPSE